MAAKISGYDALAATPADGDLVEIVDISDTTDAPTGTNKKITAANLRAAIYAEIYVNGGVTAQTTNATPDTFDLMTGFATNGSSNGATPVVASDKITCVLGGKYLVNFSVSFTGTNNEFYHFHLYNLTSNTQIAQCGAHHKIGTGTDMVTTGFCGIVSVSAGDDLGIKIAAAGSSSSFTPNEANFNVLRLSA